MVRLPSGSAGGSCKERKQRYIILIIMSNSALADLPVGKNETAAPTNKMIRGNLVGIMVDHCKIMIISEPCLHQLMQTCLCCQHSRTGPKQFGEDRVDFPQILILTLKFSQILKLFISYPQ